ncbi:MAG: 3,4-dihydroxy-2-butanone-4-phosphate synthase [Pseudomonadota bacterium]
MENKILQAVEDLKQGKMIIVADDITRENEGDIIILAEKATEESMTFIIKKASGLVCLAVDLRTANKLDLKPMVENNQESMRTAFTVSIDAKHGISTGISASDRVKTVLDVVNDSAKADDLVRPGHLFPVVAKDGGLKSRRGHTEAAIELTKLANAKPAAIICEIMGDDGKMLRGKDLDNFAKEYNLTKISVEELACFLK